MGRITTILVCVLAVSLLWCIPADAAPAVQSVVRVDAQTAGTAGDTHVVADGGGGIYVVFRDNYWNPAMPGSPTLRKSVDGGASWTTLSAGQGGIGDPNQILDTSNYDDNHFMQIDSTGVVYFMNNGDHARQPAIQASNDGGASFNAPMPLGEGDWKANSLMESSSGDVYWAQRQGGYVKTFLRKSTDRGQTWGPISGRTGWPEGPPSFECGGGGVDIDASGGPNDGMIISIQSSVTLGVTRWITTNEGASWSWNNMAGDAYNLNRTIEENFMISKADGYCYVLVDDGSNTLYCNSRGPGFGAPGAGAVIASVAGGLPEDLGNWAIEEDSTGRLYAVWPDLRSGVSKIHWATSEDKGVSWTDQGMVCDMGDSQTDPSAYVVGETVYVTWAEGSYRSSNGVAMATIPEPATLLLLVLGGIPMLLRRKK